eukprot:GEMP01022721.1.p1 GENE.GEMP01022721.1~~GEMP01022721.1.p1  ORF type:complete len:258 (-),score=51.83 GEMP01022721.1:1445-2218(-)
MIDPREVAAIADELTDKAHALVRTIVKNIIEHPTEAKYRQVNPAVIKKRCEDPDVVIKCAKVLSFLGFHGTQVAADNGTHASKNDEEGRANADADQKNEEDAQRLEIEVDDETLERLRRLLRLMPPRASEAERVRAPEAPAAAQRQSSYAALETTTEDVRLKSKDQIQNTKGKGQKRQKGRPRISVRLFSTRNARANRRATGDPDDCQWINPWCCKERRRQARTAHRVQFYQDHDDSTLGNPQKRGETGRQLDARTV